MAKIILGRYTTNRYRMVDVNEEDLDSSGQVKLMFNDREHMIHKSELYPVENIVALDSNLHLKNSINNNFSSQSKLGISLSNAQEYWLKFIANSKISEGYKHDGLHYAGFIGDNRGGWCLPSWIWTNAALVRYYCADDKIDDAILLADYLKKLQQPFGGWVVRDDYTSHGAIPVVAPNDSAYIANNAFLSLYQATNKSEYLEWAKLCGDWIISVARPDGLVATGYDERNGEWLSKYTIVDIGFTAALFANLYKITQDTKYKDFLERFVDRYISLFFIENKSAFTTSIDSDNKPIGGLFARGQAWALEGLIPAFSATHSTRIKEVINKTIDTIISYQLNNGGWAYNFAKPLLGEDCKGVPVLAKSVIDWYQFNRDEKLLNSSIKALAWCQNHTECNGPGMGGIFSFNMEGAVVHNFYTSTAFVYSSAYALELQQKVKLYEHNNIND